MFPDEFFFFSLSELEFSGGSQRAAEARFLPVRTVLAALVDPPHPRLSAVRPHARVVAIKVTLTRVSDRTHPHPPTPPVGAASTVTQEKYQCVFICEPYLSIFLSIGGIALYV